MIDRRRCKLWKDFVSNLNPVQMGTLDVTEKSNEYCEHT